MIACAYCRKENKDAAQRCWECGTEFSAPATPPPATPFQPPPLPKTTLINIDGIEAWLHFESGFHRADWKAIRHWIESNISPLDVGRAWNEAALLWVQKLREDLGGDYFILVSSQTILLCDQSGETAQWLLDYSGRIARTIKERLDRIAWQGASGKDIILVFSDQDDYYQYLSIHSPDGEQAASGGMCIDSGYTHVAFPWQDELAAANVIVHELTHDCLAHLPMPLWLNEGIAVTLEKNIGPPTVPAWHGAHAALNSALINWQPPMMWDELAEKHHSFWTAENIQSFWAGTSFFEPGDASQLSYSLAEVLVKLLLEKSEGSAFQAFIETASHSDAGQTAALDILHADLGDIAGTFLGEGSWRPQRRAMVSCWDAAGWNDTTTEESVNPQ